MRYTTLADTKTTLGISGSSQDEFLKQAILKAEARIDSMLSVSSLRLHLVEGEVHDGRNAQTLVLDDLNVREVGTITYDGQTYTQDEAYDIDNYILHLEDYLYAGEREVTIDYAAGYFVGGYAKLTVSDYSSIASGAVITLTPTSGADTLTEGSGQDWLAETSNAVTASNIADAINSTFNSDKNTQNGAYAVAVNANVYIVSETAGDEASTIAIDDLSGLSLVSGSGTVGANATNLTMDGADFPDDLLDAVHALVSIRYGRKNASGVSSYKIGSKSVVYEDKTVVMGEVMDLIQPYKRLGVHVL